MSPSFSSLLWFVGIVALIPLALWLLKRTPLGGVGAHGFMRSVAALALSPNQRVVTIEVGHGEQRRWLILGVTPNSITTLHSMEPVGPTSEPVAAASTPFAQLLEKLQQ